MWKKALIILLAAGLCSGVSAQIREGLELYKVNTPIESRSVSFENPTGEPGAGGKAVGETGPGRKGAPFKYIEPGEEVVLFDVQASGTIRHIWMTGDWAKENRKDLDNILRSTLIVAYWDGQEYPSIACPLGDFMGAAHATPTAYESAVHTIGEMEALNFWLPMPFTRSAKIVLKNESDKRFRLFYQIDYTINDQHDADIGRMHVNFRRENPTTQRADFEILPKRQGKGRFIGAVIGVRTLHPGWWGEGEIKIYMDGDQEYPTICGTGSEDWVGLSFGIQETTFQYHGCNLNFKSDSTIMAYDYPNEKEKEMQTEYISMYRWHIPDPIYWKEECRITMQQIGCCYYEREDDWSAATFWYESVPSAPLTPLPSVEARTTGLELLHKR
ncbi:glycoside hydrolase family 172 protein [Flavilitoribacter nigricans]|uniref:DUF2961 domain-containing protein n=1 Tax=Flavilitoribacter nigricans (strain ATCC 23147 / DSM 23189 / NBRC 102662 / NCIMB 1420 / SS-2) TaxID=1122177 RepID=A0A2D0N5N9_FLAN2|nr:glycoside hydrolase family 172 protein [Flavilitoribacter nigricans]PHN03469.1 hypothetical protein CRP01_26050 [Flavilitoribacter nigricans DSM 23189 = NBRC 102662]